MIRHLNLIFTALLLLASVNIAFADKAVSDLTGEDKERFDKFRHLFTTGNPNEFYSYTKEYAEYLKKQGDMNLYYKLKNNEGFYALRHNQILQAMEIAEALEKEVRENKVENYYYLPVALMGDVYYESHDMRKAEKFFLQALGEAGDRDPKFTMRTYMSLGEMQALKNPQKALEWYDKAIELAQMYNNMEYLSMSVAMKGYIHFLAGDAGKFYRSYDDYNNLRQSGDPDFSKRYNNVMEIAKLTFDGDYRDARDLMARGNLYVDSALVGIRILASEGNIKDGFSAMIQRYVELDSIYSLAQEASYDHIATERTLSLAQDEAASSQKEAKNLMYVLIGLIVVFLFVYIMGRRRLMLKIWERNKLLKDALAHAEESDRMKSAFISNMSHEIRTPLNAVAGFSSLLVESGSEIGEAEKKDMQERITNNVELITSIVDEMLELSKSESESNLRPQTEYTDVWVNQLCRGVLRSMVMKAKKGVEMRFASKLPDDFVIRTHPATVKRILYHILDNAQKFTEQGYIELRCGVDKEKHQIKLIVTDTGIGIPKEDHGRIFDLFEKGNENFKEGIGLGLPICRRLAASIGGEVELDDSYTEGSRFILTIPAIE
jgi:signal transduction histidine kinase